jgi:hypothetical protein
MNAPSSSARAGLLIVLLAAIFTYGLIRIFSIRFATGDVYPDYSSMKATPEGAKLLYDGLAGTRGLSVSRNYSPIEYSDESNAAILLLGIKATTFGEAAQPYIEPLERLAKRGNRVIAALSWDDEEKKPEHVVELEKRWHLKLDYDAKKKWLYIADAGDWRVLGRDDSRILSVEQNFEKGAIVLFAESRDFANGAVVKLDHLNRISAAIGTKNRVIFDEQHFGLGESGTVVGLARHFRLTGMGLGLILCAALFIWKNSASFPPPPESARREALSGRTSISGLNTLLRRHVKPAELAATCWKEWLVSNGRDLSPDRRVRAEAILRDRGRQPLEAVREIQTVLHAKGPL